MFIDNVENLKKMAKLVRLHSCMGLFIYFVFLKILIITSFECLYVVGTVL